MGLSKWFIVKGEQIVGKTKKVLITLLIVVAAFFAGQGAKRAWNSYSAWRELPDENLAAKMDGDYGTYRLQSEGDIVYVFVPSDEPQPRLAALIDAWHKVEAISGRKAAHLRTGGVVTGTAWFVLEPQSQPAK